MGIKKKGRREGGSKKEGREVWVVRRRGEGRGDVRGREEVRRSGEG